MTRPRAFDHHHPCPGGCGQLDDECECRKQPRRIEHLCARGRYGHEVVDGPVEGCCDDLWRDAGVFPP